MPRYSRTSRERLATCHPDLQRLFNEVIKVTDCSILEGHRTKEAQQTAFADGASECRWPRSMHNKIPSKAVDVMPYYPDSPHIRWNMADDDTARDLFRFAGIVQGMAHVLGIRVRWGGDFKTFFDGPHWELTD